MKHVFIIGCKGIPAKYGGFETFCEQLVKNKVSSEIQYHVACLGKTKGEYEYCQARCFQVPVPSIGPARVIYYDVMALQYVIEYVKKNQINDAIIYMLGCTAGPFLLPFWKKLKHLGIKLYINPDGHEWKRTKWSLPVRKYLKYSEKSIVKHCNLVISDSIGIEKYIIDTYFKYHPQTTFIAYGAYQYKEDFGINKLDDLYQWYQQFHIIHHNYYLIVGRFVPENNYETIIKEFMNSHTTKKLVIITNVEKNKFYHQLQRKTNFLNDGRIVFVGTVYDQELLYLIRKNAFGYIHGHEVGGTNPSLLESLATTDLNILLNVEFNYSVGLDCTKYFTKDPGNLAHLIDDIEKHYDASQIECLGKKAKQRIHDVYNWPLIVAQYEQLFLKG